MTESMGMWPPQEKIPEIKTLELREAEDIRKYFAFADPILGVDWGEKGVPEEYQPEYIAAHPEETQMFSATRGNEFAGGAKVAILDETAKTRLLIPAEYQEKVGVLLEYAAVAEEHRKQGVLKELTEKRLEWAKAHGAEFAACECELKNPVSALAKIKDGFVIHGACPADLSVGISTPYLVAMKDLRAEITPGKERVDIIDVLVSEDSYEELSTLFAEGWIGVEVEMPKTEGEPWKLTLERKLSENA